MHHNNHSTDLINLTTNVDMVKFTQKTVTERNTLTAIKSCKHDKYMHFEQPKNVRINENGK